MEASLPEAVVDFFFFEREDADGDAADLVVPEGDELFLLRLAFGLAADFDDADEVAFFEVFRFVFDDFVDGSTEDPGMETSEAIGLSVFEDDGVHVEEVEGWGEEVWRLSGWEVWRFSGCDGGSRV